MKSFVSIVLLFLAINGYSQEEKVYKSLEEALKTPESVIHLDLSGQGLTELPKGFKKLVNVKTMNLSKNKFTDLPNFNTFDKLEDLNLSDNPLKSKPSFITLIGENRNVVCENATFAKFTLSDRKSKSITEKDFEGSVQIPSNAIVKSDSDASGNYLKILLEGEESVNWIEVRKKGDLTNEDIIDKLLDDKINVLECFFNKQLTYDKSLDTLPPFLMYASTNGEGKVGMSGSNLVVFHDKYYIVLKSSKRYILFSDMRELLATALTFRPLSVGKNIQFSKKVFETKSADDFLMKAKIPEKITVPGVLPDLTPTKETIYTLQAGETVAFTNEYQLGTSLKDKEYYIYYKKAGKYYVKTAKNVFGPYDELPTAEPDAPFSDNFTAEFKAIKNKKSYFISNGVEMGPYPEDASLFIIDDGLGNKKPFVRYGTEKENYYEFGGRKYGPFNKFSALDFWNGKPVTNYYSYSEPITVFIDGEVKFKDIKSSEYHLVTDGHLFFTYTKDDKKYVQFDDETFGPYDAEVRKDIVDGKPRIWYKQGGKHYYYIDGKVIGPYDEIMDHYSGKILYDFTYKNGGKFYITIDGTSFGPYDTRPAAILDSEGNFCFHSFKKDGKEYFIFNGKQFGPFEKVMDVGNELTKFIKKGAKQPFITTKNVDGTFSVFTSDKNYIGMKNKPDVYYSDSLNKIALSFSETNSSGEAEYYLLMDDTKYGPFKAIFTPNYFNANYSTVYKYRFLVTTLTGKTIRVDEDGIWGPFDKVEKGYEYKPKDKCKVGDYWYINSDQKLVGPITNVDFLDPKPDNKGGGSITMEGKNVLVNLWGKGPNEIYLNNKKLDEYYIFKGSNDINFIMVTYEAGLNGGYIINNKIIKDKGLLNSAWDEETKTAYWLSLDGKNLVRYKLKL